MLLSAGMWAQQGTSSPYSYFGIGEIKFKGTFDNRAMGSLSIIPDSTHVNIQNPASVSDLKLINFSLGGAYGVSNLKTEKDQEKAKKSSIDYIAVGIPLKKFGAYFGVLPYSAVGYNLKSHNEDVSGGYDLTSTGNGGVNKGFLGIGYALSKHVSLGVDFNYNFGEISTKDDLIPSSIQYGTREVNVSKLSGYNFNAGLMWNSKVGKKHTVVGSFRYTPQSNLDSKNERQIETIKATNNGTNTLVDQSESTQSNTTIKMPSRMSAGIGFGKVRKWMLGGEFTLTDMDNFSNRLTDINNSTYKTSQRYVLGGYYIPKYNSYSSYFKTMTYRYGFRYDTAGLVVNGQPINDMALSLGAGLPIGGKFSNFNIGFEFGTKGTTKSSLVQENYFNLLLSFSFNDQWFQRRRYN